MIDVRGLVHTTLDTALAGTNVKVFWQRRVEISGDQNPNEYIIYTLDGYDYIEFADDAPLISSADVAVRYFYRREKIESQTGRTSVKSREDTIIDSLEAAGFILSGGPMDAGDVDDIGFLTTVFEFTYETVV